MSVPEILASYNDKAALPDASTIPAPWYVDAPIAELEAQTVFSRTWQLVGRAEQVEKPGQFVTASIAGEPIVVVRGNDGVCAASTTCAVITPRRWLPSLADRLPFCTVPITAGTTGWTVLSRGCRNSTA